MVIGYGECPIGSLVSRPQQPISVFPPRRPRIPILDAGDCAACCISSPFYCYQGRE
ncbi:expressed unknown protein [Ectocarpus siliculosus]|uniref:Uncharacterized protein n=1 Tax=Ectocarpus siliculosus TaxID=2880 RepID=D8LIA2_ECTSI|nr:expressed unknown protein [Ectocarpus siliculosus]|eukprot:CBN79405.1 expressed unknown protein [Ectocarpus siliculosus]